MPKPTIPRKRRIWNQHIRPRLLKTQYFFEDAFHNARRLAKVPAEILQRRRDRKAIAEKERSAAAEKAHIENVVREMHSKFQQLRQNPEFFRRVQEKLAELAERGAGISMAREHGHQRLAAESLADEPLALRAYNATKLQVSVGEPGEAEDRRKELQELRQLVEIEIFLREHHAEPKAKELFLEKFKAK